MILTTVLEVLNNLTIITDIRKYNSTYYELLTLLDRHDLTEDHTRYRELLHNSLLPGEYIYSIQKDYVSSDMLLQAKRELAYTFPVLLEAAPTSHLKIRARNSRYIDALVHCVTAMLAILFDVERYRIQLRYYDGTVYSTPNNYSRPSAYNILNYDHYIYRTLAPGVYRGVRLNLISGEHDSATLEQDGKFVGHLRPLHNYLFPENAI